MLLKKILLTTTISLCFLAPTFSQGSGDETLKAGKHYVNIGFLRLEYFHSINKEYHLLIGARPFAAEYTPFYIKRNEFSSYEGHGWPLMIGDFWLGVSQQKRFGRFDYFLAYTRSARSGYFNNGGERYPPYEGEYHTYNANGDHLFGVGFAYSYHFNKWFVISHGLKFRLSTSGLNKFVESHEFGSFSTHDHKSAIGYLSVNLLRISVEF